MMDCIIYFLAPSKKERYSVEVSLDDGVQKGLNKLITQEDISRNDVHDIFTKKGRQLSLNDTFRAQDVRAGAELIMRKRKAKISNQVKMYGILGSSIILVLLVVIIVLAISGSGKEELSLSDKSSMLDSNIIKDQGPTQPASEEEVSQIDVQNLEREINLLTYPSTSYSSRKERKKFIIYNYFSGPNAKVLEKFQSIPTNTTTIDQWLGEFIIQDNSQIKIRKEGIRHQNGKINSIVIQNDELF